MKLRITESRQGRNLSYGSALFYILFWWETEASNDSSYGQVWQAGFATVLSSHQERAGHALILRKHLWVSCWPMYPSPESNTEDETSLLRCKWEIRAQTSHLLLLQFHNSDLLYLHSIISMCSLLTWEILNLLVPSSWISLRFTISPSKHQFIVFKNRNFCSSGWCWAYVAWQVCRSFLSCWEWTKGTMASLSADGLWNNVSSESSRPG